MIIRWEAEGATDIGRMRRGNEDTFLVDSERGIFLVADGMGGHAAGEVASGLAAETVARALAQGVDEGRSSDNLVQVVADAFAMAWKEIDQCCRDDPRKTGMGTTLTVCLLRPDGTCIIGHIGDSRAYRLRGERFEPLTRDHTWVQREVEAGRLQASAAESHPLSHILTRVLSADLPPQPDLLSPDVQPGDFLLLCTDGLHGLVPEQELRSTATSDGPLAELLATMIQQANASGGRDNITAVGLRIFPADG
jgi:PPM family protein phosphatase